MAETLNKSVDQADRKGKFGAVKIADEVIA